MPELENVLEAKLMIMSSTLLMEIRFCNGEILPVDSRSNVSRKRMITLRFSECLFISITAEYKPA